MKKLTTVLALLMLPLFYCIETEAKPNDAGNLKQNGIVSNLDDPSSIHQGDSLAYEFSYPNTYEAKDKRVAYIKQITGAICLLFAWLLIESDKD